MSLSVLLSAYSGTRAHELERCLDSLERQTRKATEIVLVLDGPVEAGTRSCCESMTRRLPLKVLEYEENRGLGWALRDGLAHCTNEYVARMDTDDVTAEYRFSEQLSFLKGNPDVSLVGGVLREHHGAGQASVPVDRKLPDSHNEIVKFAKLRNPLNHPTVMFRRDDILEVGSYQSFPLLEDYHLAVRLIMAGKRLRNLDRVLVETWPDDAFFERRGGLNYLKQELKLSSYFRSIGFHNTWESILFCAMRTPYRLAPGGFRKRMYRVFLRNRREYHRVSL